MASTTPSGSIVQRIAVAGALGLAAGVTTAWAYYTLGLRVLAHEFVMWVGLLVVVSARRPTRQAVAAASTFLVASVLSFYIGKDVGHDLKHPGSELLSAS